MNISDVILEALKLFNKVAERKLTNQITLDLDGKAWTEDKVEKLVHRIYKKEWNVECISVFKSPSGNGYHLYCYLCNYIPYEEQFRLRKKYGDDPVRLKYSKLDYKQGFDPDVMFTMKKYGSKKQGKWINEWKYEQFIYIYPYAYVNSWSEK